MAKPSITVPLPSLDAGLVVNLFAVVSLAAVCVAVAFLTDWRWGVLAAGVLGFASAVYVSRNMPAAVAMDNVTQMKKAA